MPSSDVAVPTVIIPKPCKAIQNRVREPIWNKQGNFLKFRSMLPLKRLNATNSDDESTI